MKANDLFFIAFLSFHSVLGGEGILLPPPPAPSSSGKNECEKLRFVSTIIYIDRGEQHMKESFRGHKRAEQLIDYNGLAYDTELRRVDGGPVRPADIDGCMELHSNRSHVLQIGQGFLFLELKLDIAEMDYGQESMYKKLAEYTARGGACSYVVELHHYVYDKDQDIDAAKSYVRRYYSGSDREWYIPARAITAAEFQDLFVQEMKSGKPVRDAIEFCA